MEAVYVVLVLGLLLALYLLFGRGTKSDTGRPASVDEKSQPSLSRGAEDPKGEAPPVSAPTSKRKTPPKRFIQPEFATPSSPAGPDGPRSSLAPVHDVEGMRRGLARSRGEEGFFGRLRALFTGKREIGADIASEIEEVLLTSDVGVDTTRAILDRVREALTLAELSDSARVWEALRGEARRILEVNGDFGSFKLVGAPTVVLLVGVNGAGKTTTIGKLAAKLKAQGHRSILAAGDTFRAAAVQQLGVWGERTGSEVVRGKDGADPSSVIFEAIKKGQAEGADVVLADTAGRLHTKTNLMFEMQKIVKSAAKALDGAPHEVLLVIDATNGQNALAQAREFKEALPLTGIVLTKLDGTAKGGVIFGICDALKLPVRFVGLGERPDDLYEFSPEDFVEALLGKDASPDGA